MTIRKLQYAIDYIHVLTFKDHLKQLMAPYFDYDHLEYAVDNENTINEAGRLIFKNEGFAMQFKKDGVALVYEGDVSAVKRSGNPVLEIFFKIFSDITRLPHYSRTTRHRITVDGVEILEKKHAEEIMSKNNFLTNPFVALDEFAAILIFKQEQKEVKLQLGNYSDKDIKKYDLTPFNTIFNKAIIGAKGLMCQLTVQEEISSGSFSKFKELLSFAELLMKKYLDSTNNERGSITY